MSNLNRLKKLQAERKSSKKYPRKKRTNNFVGKLTPHIYKTKKKC